jgi:C4-dicarboxylate-specific signal transduction histidine kinase
MGAPKRERSWTDRPISGRVPASMPACIATLLAVASETDGGEDWMAVVRRMLDVLVELEPEAVAAVILEQGRETVVLHRTRLSLPSLPAQPNDDGRLFPDMAAERHVPLGGILYGSLHYATPSAFVNATSESYELLLHQAACAIQLAVRALRTEAALEASERHHAQLDKLATLGQTAASVVHELNNPLTAIVAYTDFLERRLAMRRAPHTDLERLRRIAEAAARIQHFCRELTDYSRPAGRLHGPIDLHEVIDRALRFCMHGLRDSDITVERRYRDVPIVEGIDGQLTQVFVNLITNAAHAMSGMQGATLNITTRADATHVEVTIADDGHGIPEDTLPRIFDSYFTTKAQGEGVGLGLSIVRRIVSDHGGTIRAENRPEGGTVFSIALPIGMGS